MRRFHLRSLGKMAGLFLAGPIIATATQLSAAEVQSSSPSTIEAVHGEYVVQLRKPHSAEEFALQARQRGMEVLEHLRSDLILVRVSEQLVKKSKANRRLNSSTFQKLSTLQKLNSVAVAEPNYIYRATKLPNDPEIAKLWGLKNAGSADSAGTRGLPGIDVGAEAAWDIHTGSKSVVVAVIDSGIDFTHPDLAPQAWVNEQELNGVAGVDDDGNGFVDDINGFNFADNKGDSTDDQGHGTHCAGTIGAKGNDARGLVGVNWDVSLMAVKFLDKSGTGNLANAIKSIDYARKMGARIMSNSWGGGGQSAILKQAIEDANKAGILFVAAAGNQTMNNDLTPTYPANYDVENILSVAAIDNRGGLAPFSNYGQKTVHVAAPGVNIFSTVLGGKYDSYSGTSMAAPHVSGIAALILAHDSTLSHTGIKKRIIESARPLYTLKNRVSSMGIVDAYYALSGLTPPLDPNDPSRLPNFQPYQLESDHPYKENTKFSHRIQIPGATRLAIKFSRFETELGYDTVSFYDAAGILIGSMSGNQDDGIISPLIYGDTVVIKFQSDETVNSYGFAVESILFE